MKSQIVLFFSLAFVMIVSSLTAQSVEGSYSMSVGTQNGWMITIPNSKKSNVEDQWKDFIKTYKGKTKKDKKSDELFTEKAEIPNLSSTSTNVYAKFVQQGNDVVMYSVYDLGGAYLNTQAHPTAAPIASNLVNQFALQVAKNTMTDIIKKEEDKLNDLNKDLKGLQKDKSNYEDDITKAEKKIADSKLKIEKNINDQKLKESDIAKQTTNIQDLKRQLDQLR